MSLVGVPPRPPAFRREPESVERFTRDLETGQYRGLGRRCSDSSAPRDFWNVILSIAALVILTQLLFPDFWQAILHTGNNLFWYCDGPTPR